MVQRVQRFLGHSYTIQTWLDEDFLYVYFLWINIPNNPLGVSPPPSVLLVPPRSKPTPSVLLVPPRSKPTPPLSSGSSSMCWITTCTTEILSCKENAY